MLPLDYSASITDFSRTLTRLFAQQGTLSSVSKLLKKIDFHIIILNIFPVPDAAPRISAEAKEKLKDWFAPHMASFAFMTNDTFPWAYLPQVAHIDMPTGNGWADGWT